MPFVEKHGIRFTRGCLAGTSRFLRKAETTIGRSGRNDWVGYDIMVSQRHAIITLCGAAVLILATCARR